MGNGLVAFLAAGKKFPEGFAEKALAEYQGELAVVAAHEGVIGIESGNEPVELEELETLLYGEDLLDKERFVFFGAGEKFGEEDMQPFFAVTSEGENGAENPEIVCFIVSPEWDRNKIKTVFEQLLKTQVKRFVRMTGGDLAKVWEELNDTGQITEWSNLGSPAHIIMLASSGDYVTYDNTERCQTDFGWLTDATLLVGEQAKEEPKPEPVITKKGGFFGNKPKATTTPAAEPPKPAEPAKDKKADKEPAIVKDFKELSEKINGGNKPPNLDPGQVRLTEAEMHYQPPATVTDPKMIKKLYDDNAGFVPQDWEKKTKVRLTQKLIKQKLKEKQRALSTKTETAVHTVQQNGDNKTAQAADDATIKAGILTAGQKEQVASFFKIDSVKSDLDNSSKEMPTPEEMKAMEDEEVSFALQTGLVGLEATFRWSPKALVILAEKVPHAAAILVRDYRHRYLKALRDIAKLEAQVKGQATEVKKDEPVATTKPAAATTAKPKGNFFGTRKAS